jgi:hypothetical protein
MLKLGVGPGDRLPTSPTESRDALHFNVNPLRPREAVSTASVGFEGWVRSVVTTSTSSIFTWLEFPLLSIA